MAKILEGGDRFRPTPSDSDKEKAPEDAAVAQNVEAEGDDDSPEQDKLDFLNKATWAAAEIYYFVRDLPDFNFTRKKYDKFPNFWEHYSDEDFINAHRMSSRSDWQQFPMRYVCLYFELKKRYDAEKARLSSDEEKE